MTHVEYGIDEFTRHHGFLALVNYTKYDIYCQYGNFLDDDSYE